MLISQQKEVKTALSAAVDAGDVYSAIFLVEKGAKLTNVNVVPGENVKTQADYVWFEGALLSGCVEICYWLAVIVPLFQPIFPTPSLDWVANVSGTVDRSFL